MIEYWLQWLFVNTMLWGLVAGLNVLIWWTIIERLVDEIQRWRKK